MTSLQELFDESLGLLSEKGLYDRAKKQKLNVTHAEVKEFLKSQQVAQQFKQKRIVEYPIIGKPGAYMCDLMFISEARGQAVVFLVEHMTSRYMYGKVLPNKKGATVLKAFKDIVESAKSDDRPIKILESDLGSEFINKDFLEYQKTEGIESVLLRAGNKNPMGLIESANKTIRSYIEKLKSQDLNWKRRWATIMKEYNSHTVKTIKMSPDDVSKKDEVKIRIDAHFRASKAEGLLRAIARRKPTVLLQRKRETFSKLGVNFLKTPHQVLGRIGNRLQIEGQDVPRTINEILETKADLKKPAPEKVHATVKQISKIQKVKREVSKITDFLKAPPVKEPVKATEPAPRKRKTEAERLRDFLQAPKV